MIRVLALLCALFTAAVAAEVLSGPTNEPRAAPLVRHRLDAEPLQHAPATQAARERWLQDVLARPLFAPSRRPAPGSAATDPGLPRLAGIIRSSAGTVAIFQPSGDGKPVLAHHGDSVGGWQVAAIGPEDVTLRKQGTQVVLSPRFAAPAATSLNLRPAAPLTFPMAGSRVAPMPAHSANRR